MAPSEYIVGEKGNPTAVIFPIEEYNKMLSIMEGVEGNRESRIFFQSSAFKKLSKKGWRIVSKAELSLGKSM